jgi:uncharacterized repeat protein (TIGR03803 family)
MEKFGSARILFSLFLGAAISIAATAQTLKTVAYFSTAAGYDSTATLVQGANGNLYGTALYGGAYVTGQGTVFTITPAGQLSDLYSFCAQKGCPDGEYPGGLIQSANGNFYGTTGEGGPDGAGTLFEMTPSGTLTTLYGFAYPEGSSGVIQADDGDFYSTSMGGGLYGSVFKITPAGVLTTLYTFCAQTNCTDGSAPLGLLVQATDGDFYGTTNAGGAYVYYGTVFKMTPQGVLTTLHSFDSSDGAFPNGGLVQGRDGNFYGTTSYAGAHNTGTVFEITAGGKFTTLHSFCSEVNCADGSTPKVGLVQGSDGNFYGTTSLGGANGPCYYEEGCGTIFEVADGKLTTLYSFCSQTNCDDGQIPFTALLQATNGSFYGTTRAGGADSGGTIFSLSVGLGPFVVTRPTSGKVGAKVTVLGNKLTSATNVSFNGTATTFKVISSTEITATVPTGATSGTVEVTTAGGTLKSNVAFRVSP